MAFGPRDLSIVAISWLIVPAPPTGGFPFTKVKSPIPMAWRWELLSTGGMGMALGPSDLSNVTRPWHVIPGTSSGPPTTSRFVGHFVSTWRAPQSLMLD